MEFMSDEHIRAMNQLLAESSELASELTALTDTVRLTYEMSNGRDGKTERWQLALDNAKMAFTLEVAEPSTLTFTGEFRKLVEAAQAARAGQPIDPEISAAGDVAVMAQIGPAMAIMQATVAALPVTYASE